VIKERVKKILSQLPADVELVAAAKTRGAQEIIEAVKAGVRIIGENYVQETERVQREIRERNPEIADRIVWHFIGHLQTNKVKKAIEMFDMIETVDSLEIAREIEKRCAHLKRVMPILVEVNSARERQKFGVFPEKVEELVRRLAELRYVKVMGLMTMGPQGESEEMRLYFRDTRRIFERIKSKGIRNVEMRYLSMGMSNSYRVAIEEGANIVRIGTGIFGERSTAL